MRSVVHDAGQRFMFGFSGHEPSADLRRLVRDFALGGVIVFARNVDSPEQLADLVRELQSIGRDAGLAAPLLVAVDQEGGRVQRLRRPWTEWPPIRLLGRSGDVDATRRMARALAVELVACGIHYDFAPVVDVDSNPKNPVIGDRSFSSDRDVVMRLAAAFIEELQAGGVAACAKHFPGHGDTELDSHLDLPVVAHPRSRLEEIEIPPFARAIEAGVASIMTAHVLCPEIDAKLPATLSPRLIREWLRKDLGYDGVVVGDDLEMKAVAKTWTVGESAVLAAKAGCDLILVCSTSVEAQVAAMEGMIHAFETEEITATERDDSARRLRRLKERFVLPYGDPDPRQARAAAGRAEHQALAMEIADRGGIAV